MKIKDLRNKNMNELKKMVEEHRNVLETLMHDIYKGKEKNVAKVRSHRKNIARIKTILAEKKFLKDEVNV